MCYEDVCGVRAVYDCMTANIEWAVTVLLPILSSACYSADIRQCISVSRSVYSLSNMYNPFASLFTPVLSCVDNICYVCASDKENRLLWKARNSDVISESRSPQPHYEFTAFFFLGTNFYSVIIYWANIYKNKDVVWTVKDGWEFNSRWK